MKKVLTFLTLAIAVHTFAQCPKGYTCEESAVKPYKLLDPLTSLNGKRIRSTADWPTRHAEIQKLFEENVFGRTPNSAQHLPLRSHIDEQDDYALNGLAIRKQVTLYFSPKLEAGPKEHILLYLPAHHTGPTPIILGLNFQGNHTVLDDPAIRLNPTWTRVPKSTETPHLAVPDEATRGKQTEEWQVEKILSRGYGFATIYYGDIEPDYKDSYQFGIRPTFFAAGQTSPAPGDWGAIGAWAWGLSRALDYLQTEPLIDPHRIALTGHSRLGKTADWAFAQDPRFAALLSTESGKAGQSLTRRTFGENIAHLQHSFPYWFCANYAKWVDRDTEIPADGNLLLALATPRPIYVASAEGDLWSDPRGEFLSALDVSRVYKLFGKPGISTATMPAVDQPTNPATFVAYHVRTGKHDVTAFDWDQYLNFLDAHFHPAVFTFLQPKNYHHYITQFAADEREATNKDAPDEWPWLQQNIPLFDSSNKQFEEMYYFRWYAWQKHVVNTKRGFVITEWLPKPDAKDGFFGALPDAAMFHLGEARWLRNRKIADDDARFWLSPDADPRKYSDPIAATVRNVTLATGDTKLATDLLPQLIANYRAWESTNLDTDVGLYWQIDTRDAMEKSIGGDGYRPPLNSYQFADATAIAAIATDPAVKQDFANKASTLQHLVETKLWNPTDKFYEDLSPSSDSGIRKQKKFIDPGTQLKLSGVRELIGYIPWQFNLPSPTRAIAWKQLFDPQGFAGKYGPTTAERRSPRFRFASGDQCTWNGPSWPFATTQTLLGLANLLNGPAQPYIGKADYYQLFSNYILSQHLTLASGRIIDWIDEDLDADTDDWIAKRMLLAKNKQVGRGNYYNHSGFADPLITGLIGLRPQPDDRLIIHPLLPANTWTYFALDGLPYHGHILTIVYDRTGKRYNRGLGLTVFVDGKKLASRPTLGPIETHLSH